MNLDDLATFVRVVELGTFTAAAQAEGVPKSTVSRRVARLEDQLGVALLQRSARSFTVTDDGRLLVRRAAGAVRELEEIGQVIDDLAGVPRGRLVLTTAHDLGRQRQVAELIAAYRSAHPQVTVEVRLEERMVDLVREGVDVALRAHGAPRIPGEAGLMARAVGGARSGLFGSAAYLESRGAPRTPEALVEHDLVAHVATADRPLRLWSHGEERVVELPEPVAVVNDFGLAEGLIAAGVGLGLLPSAATPIDALVRVLPEWQGQAGYLSLVWPDSRHQSPRVRAFIDLAVQRLTAWTA